MQSKSEKIRTNQQDSQWVAELSLFPFLKKSFPISARLYSHHKKLSSPNFHLVQQALQHA